MDLQLHRIDTGCYAPGNYDILIYREPSRDWSIRLYAQWTKWGRQAAPEMEALRFPTRAAAWAYLQALFATDPPPEPASPKAMSLLNREQDGSYTYRSRSGQKMTVRRESRRWQVYNPDGSKRDGLWTSLWELRLLGLYDA